MGLVIKSGVRVNSIEKVPRRFSHYGNHFVRDAGLWKVPSSTGQSLGTRNVSRRTQLNSYLVFSETMNSRTHGVRQR